MLTISTGNNAVAAAVREAGTGVVAAYPITPQTEIVEQIANFVTKGSMKASYIPVESEHSAMAACIGASITGIRTFTATSSHGLLYMNEMVNWAAAARLPIVMANVNRALGPGWNVWAEHTDSLQARDTGWLQVYVATVQEAYDATLMAFRIAEDRRVYLPVMVNLDGFTLSHITQQLEDVKIGDFIPPLVLDHKIDPAHPGGYGCMTSSVDYVRIRSDIERSMRDSVEVIRETEAEFAKRFGRSYSWTDDYRCEDAEVLILSMGTLGKEAEVAIDILRSEGVKAGSMRVRWIRPFPNLDLGDRELVVIDRNYSFGFGGILAGSIRAKTGKTCYNVIAGLGGQEVTYHDIASFVRNRKIGTEEWFGVKI
ncbi:MAG: pyruvate ferredoxin oxidoreductase [Methanospirillum sp.]|uniref:pyruvate ferredoxin oxidoreductase n=1 Tax=Methanospirillum sp. TaxID=45200 RepID=UPI002372D966|nr:pyruvate ferredoxin oxidoreductase [Methanospirillum sp.]MDD1728897.1 pyruvate ferredoxin oxidoreductase [Methanospirillum sp.]